MSHCALASHSDVPGHWRQRYTVYPLGMSGEKCEVDALTVVMPPRGAGLPMASCVILPPEPADSGQRW